MSPELNRSEDRGVELATTEQAAQPAAVREPGHSPPADKTSQPPDDTGLTAHHRSQVTEPAADQADGGLLADAARLHAGWQRIQAGFVDDPREAVADAADLVEHTAQAFVGALQQRQRQLRGMWNGDGRPAGTAEQITDT